VIWPIWEYRRTHQTLTPKRELEHNLLTPMEGRRTQPADANGREEKEEGAKESD
jgi:hypothetical protein